MLVPQLRSGPWRLVTGAPVEALLQCPGATSVIATFYFVPSPACDLTLIATSPRTTWRAAPIA